MGTDTLDADAANRLRNRVRELESALRIIEKHHIKQNAAKGRDERESFTLTICREALSTYDAEREADIDRPASSPVSFRDVHGILKPKR